MHVTCSNADHSKSLLTKIPIPGCIALRAIPARMSLSVHFDNKPSFKAAKICLIWSNRVLTSKFHSQLLAAQLFPQQHFGQAHLPSQVPGSIDLWPSQALRTPSTTLRAVPLPVPGRIVFCHHAAHPFLSIHAAQAPLARSRTWPM